MRINSLAIALTLALGLGLATSAHAQSVPGTVHFTGRLTTTAGAPVSGPHDVVARLFDAATTGSQVWSETHTAASFTNGLVYLTLGETTALDSTVLDGGPLFLELTIDGVAMNPRLALASVPYAVRADVASTADVAGMLGTIAPSNVVTAVSAGSGLTGGGMGGTVTVGLQSCLPNQYLTYNGSSWGCSTVPPMIDFLAAGGDNGSALTAARSDHLHDGRYYTEGELNTSGVINTAGNPLEWTRLKGVPPGLADGVDGDTTYTNGAGITLSGNVFAAAFTAAGGDAGNGTTVARGDHAHDGRYPIQAGRPGGQVLYGGTGLGEDLVLRSTISGTRGEIYLGDDGSAVSIGGGAPSSTLDVAGEIRSNDIVKIGTAPAAAYERSHTRYIVEAPPSSVGVVVPLDQALVDALCRDRDGCDVIVSMVNWDQPGMPGSATSRIMHLMLSETSRWWRFDDKNGEPTGLDGANGVQEIQSWDCYLGDSETYLGTPNGRADASTGWGLLNCAGCNYSDTTTTCRVIIED